MLSQRSIAFALDKKWVTSCPVTLCHWELESNRSCLRFQVSHGVCLGEEVHMTGWSFWRRPFGEAVAALWKYLTAGIRRQMWVCQQRSAAWWCTALPHYVYATTGISIYSKRLLFTSLTLNIWYPLWILMDRCTVLRFLACHLICLYSDSLNELVSDVRNHVVCHNNLFYKITGQSFLCFYSKDSFSALLAPDDSKKKCFEQERRKQKSKTETKLHCQVFILLQPS